MECKPFNFSPRMSTTNHMASKLHNVRNNYKELSIINEKQQKRVQYLETKAMHLCMFYIAIQCLTLSSVSNPSSVIHCSSWKEPFYLSLLMAIIFALSFGTTVIKYVHTQYYYEENMIDQQVNFGQMVMLEKQQHDIEVGVAQTRMDRPSLKPDMFVVYQRYVYIFVIVLALLAFTVLVLRACHASVCSADA